MIATHKSTDILRECSAVDIFWYLDHLQVRISHTLALSLREGQQQENDVVLLTGIEASNHTKVH